MSARTQIHGVSPLEGLDRLALIVAFVVGVGGGVLLKLTSAPILATALFPVAVLVGYVAVCALARRLAIEPETVGDNSYYLGFLFTLASLATTLYQIHDLDMERGTAEHLIPSIISGFGVALTSTIVGVFLRVMLMQLRPDVVARDREARRDLLHGARDFRQSIAEASREIKTVTIEVAQHTAEREARIAEITDEHFSQSRQLLDRQAEKMDATIAAFVDRLSTELARCVRESFEDAMDDVADSAGRLASSLREMAAIQEGGRAAMSEANDELAQSAVKFRQVMGDHHQAALNAYRNLGARANKIAETFGAATTAFEANTKMLEASFVREEGARSVRADRLLENFDHLELGLKDVTATLRELTGAQGDLLANAKFDHVELGLKEVAETLRDVATAHGDLLEKQREKIHLHASGPASGSMVEVARPIVVISAGDYVSDLDAARSATPATLP